VAHHNLVHDLLDLHACRDKFMSRLNLDLDVARSRGLAIGAVHPQVLLEHLEGT
jgi:hypothetical protein